MKKTIAVEIETNAKIINGHLFFAIVTDRKGRFMMRITGDRCFNAHKLIAIQRKPSIHWTILRKGVGTWNEELKILQKGKEPHKFNQVIWQPGELGRTNQRKLKSWKEDTSNLPHFATKLQWSENSDEEEEEEEEEEEVSENPPLHVEAS